MSRREFLKTAIGGLMVLPVVFAFAAEPEGAPKQTPPAKPEPIFGSQLMTPEERAAYRAKMRTAKSAEECEKIRKEHHEAMKLRAKERGVTLPDEPPPMGGGMGRGPCNGGMGAGRGPGGGRGPAY